MTMSFLPYDTMEPITSYEPGGSQSRGRAETAVFDFTARRFRVPRISNAIERPRAERLLERSLQNYPATILCGRSGTGKTALAATLAGRMLPAAWNSIEPPDVDFRSFGAGVFVSYRGNSVGRIVELHIESPDHDLETIANVVDRLLDESEKLPSLFVWDNVHHLFDTKWFQEFVGQFIAALPPTTRVLLLSRSKPAMPLWRMRSKQFVNVIDEKAYGFNEEETVRLFLKMGLSKASARVAYRSGFGNIKQALRVANSLRKNRSIR